MKSRRFFLKQAAAVTAGLTISPSFNYLLAKETVNEQPHRFIFIRKSNGNKPKQFSLPTFSDKEKTMDGKKEAFVADLDKHELPEFMRPLEAYKESMSIFHGISCEMSEGGHWSFSSPMGVFKSGRNSLSKIKRRTIDYELASLFPSPFGHVEFSFAQNRTGIVSGYSAPAPHQRNHCYADPVTARNELFKTILDPGVINTENSMLSFLEEEEAIKIAADRRLEKDKMTMHIRSLTDVQSRNKQVQSLSDKLTKHLPELSKDLFVDGGKSAKTSVRQKGMTDVLIASLVTGLTNVVTYTIDTLGTPMTGLPGNENDRIGIHDIGHNKVYSGVPADTVRNKIKHTHMLQIEMIIKSLKSIPEGNGNMFDNTTIIYMPETGAGHHGPNTEMPMIVLTGKNSKLDMAGRYIRLPFHATEGHKTLGNWYTTLLNLYGNPIEHYGDLDLVMHRKRMPQLGAIDQIMKKA